MNRTIAIALLVTLLVLAVGGTAAYFGYQAGAAQALALAAAPAPGMLALGYGPWGPGAALATCVLPLVVLFLGLGLLRLAFGPRHGPHAGWHSAWRGRPGWGEEPPPFFQAWHENIHAAPAQPDQPSN